MTKALVTTDERFRRHQRDLEAYRRRSLYRRSFARFRRDLSVVPHVFLVTGTTSIAPLERSREDVLAALRGRAVWTLDTAVRLAGCRGFLRSIDLTGYLTGERLHELVAGGFIGEPSVAGLSVDPPYRRHLRSSPTSTLPTRRRRFRSRRAISSSLGIASCATSSAPSAGGRTC